jgi:hypothetical protein
MSINIDVVISHNNVPNNLLALFNNNIINNNIY